MPQDDIPVEGQDSAPATAPASLSSEQIAEIVTAAIDARIPKLQSAYDTRINDLEQQLRQSDMDEDEIAADREAKLQQQLESARTEADIQKAARVYPDAYPVFEQIREATNAEEQLKIIATKLAKPADAAPAPDDSADDDADDTPPVDPNQAPTEPAAAAGKMTAERANRIIEMAGGIWPGRG